VGRKSLQTERRAQILDACEAVVLDEGLSAASPSRIAEQVGLDRSTVHHYFRTQADLLAGLVERIVDGYLSEVREVSHARGHEAGIGEILDLLLSPEFSLPRYDRLVDEFAAASHHDDEVRRQLRRLYRTLEKASVEMFLKAMPAADPERVRDTAYAVYALVEGAYLLHAQGFPANRLRAARQTAHQLVEALQNETPVA
jgi:AcrR family transcriptional regulator